MLFIWFYKNFVTTMNKTLEINGTQMVFITNLYIIISDTDSVFSEIYGRTWFIKWTDVIILKTFSLKKCVFDSHCYLKDAKYDYNIVFKKTITFTPGPSSRPTSTRSSPDIPADFSCFPESSGQEMFEAIKLCRSRLSRDCLSCAAI
jgi:hypothetical protein